MVNTYDVGDTAPLRLLIDVADTTTVATVTARAPSGQVAELAASPSPERTEWTTALRLTEPGVWSTTWTVVGVGAGVETHRLIARAVRAARAYAHSGDLAAWTRELPADADELLARATRVIDRVMVGARWEPLEGSDNLPADPGVARAYADATCAQVLAWLEAGAGDFGEPEGDSDADEAERLAAWARSVGATSVAFEGISIGLGKSSSSGTSSAADTSSGPDWTTAAPAALDVLLTAGLYPPRIGRR